MGNLLFLAYPLGNLGRIALLEGDITTARRSFAECVAYSRRNNNLVSLVDWLARLGSVAIFAGDTLAARAALREAYTLANDLAYQSIIPHIQACLALTESIVENDRQAQHYLQQSPAGYTTSVAAAVQAASLDTLYLSRPDVLDALVAAAYLHHKATQLERALVLLSGIRQLLGSQSYQLDRPHQANRCFA